MQLAGVAIPLMSSNKFEKYCDGIVKNLQDEKTYGSSIPDALKMLDTVLKGNYGRDKAKDVSFITTADSMHNIRSQVRFCRNHVVNYHSTFANSSRGLRIGWRTICFPVMQWTPNSFDICAC